MVNLRETSHVRVGAAWSAALAFAAIAPACKPTLDETVSIVNEPIVLAVRSEPAEAAAQAVVKYSALYVDGAGPIANAHVGWAFCEARKPLAELGPVNTECEEASGAWFAPLGEGLQVSGKVPADACRLFGPDVPPAVEGQPQGRPVDPDSTGGYYDPVRVLAPDGSVTIAETRLACGAGAVPGALSVDYAHRYHVNTNPAVSSLSVVDGSGHAAPLMTSDEGVNPVLRGAHVTLRLAWRACPVGKDVCGDGICGPDETAEDCPADCTNPVGCTGAERFITFDVASQELAVPRESMAAAWYATGGSFDSDRTGRDATDSATTSDNGWTAPAEAGKIHLWAVLRDNRGGAGWAEYVLEVH